MKNKGGSWELLLTKEEGVELADSNLSSSIKISAPLFLPH